MKTDKKKFIELLEIHKNIIYKIARSYCKYESNLSDLVQEITIQLWHAYPKYDERFRFSTWLYRIALNVSISFYRKLKRKEESFQPLPESDIGITESELSDEKSKNLDLLQKFIYELKELDRALVILYLDEKSHKDISEILGITESNVSTKISRIKKFLKQKFTEERR